MYRQITGEQGAGEQVGRAQSGDRKWRGSPGTSTGWMEKWQLCPLGHEGVRVKMKAAESNLPAAHLSEQTRALVLLRLFEQRPAVTRQSELPEGSIRSLTLQSWTSGMEISVRPLSLNVGLKLFLHLDENVENHYTGRSLYLLLTSEACDSNVSESEAPPLCQTRPPHIFLLSDRGFGVDWAAGQDSSPRPAVT